MKMKRTKDMLKPIYILAMLILGIGLLFTACEDSSVTPQQVEEEQVQDGDTTGPCDLEPCKPGCPNYGTPVCGMCPDPYNPNCAGYIPPIDI